MIVLAVGVVVVILLHLLPYVRVRLFSLNQAAYDYSCRCLLVILFLFPLQTTHYLLFFKR